jgi:hypothetical protein
MPVILALPLLAAEIVTGEFTLDPATGEQTFTPTVDATHPVGGAALDKPVNTHLRDPGSGVQV